MTLRSSLGFSVVIRGTLETNGCLGRKQLDQLGNGKWVLDLCGTEVDFVGFHFFCLRVFRRDEGWIFRIDF